LAFCAGGASLFTQGPFAVFPMFPSRDSQDLPSGPPHQALTMAVALSKLELYGCML
jgi:hypothetical protein